MIVVLTAAIRAARPAARPASLPAVSVLIAALDEADSIPLTLRSVLAQRGVELEVIVADDGSTDGTADVVTRAFGGAVRVLRLRAEEKAQRSSARARWRRTRCW